MNVGEEHHGAIAKRVRDHGAKRLEHIQVRVDGLTRVEVEAVLAAPTKGRTIDPLKTSQVDSAVGEDSHVLVLEILTHNTYQANIGKE